MMMVSPSDFLSQWKASAPKLAAFLKNRVRDTMAAEDILQEVYIKTQTHYGQLRDTNKIQGWFYKITSSVLADYYRKRKDHINLDSVDIAEVPTKNYNEVFVQCLPACIECLPELYRVALKMAEVEKLPITEIATKLGLSYTATKSRVQRARQKLKELYEGCYSFEADKYGNIVEYTEKSVSNSC